MTRTRRNILVVVFVISSLGGGPGMGIALADDLVLASGWAQLPGDASGVSHSGNNLAVDQANGHIVFTGRAPWDTGTTKKSRIETWMYDQNGNVMPGWPQFWPPVPDGPSYGVGLAFPTSGTGSVFVVGAYYQGGQDLNIVLLCYNSDGTLAPGYPVKYNNDLVNGPDYPVDVAIDGSGRTWVLGTITGSLTGGSTGTDIFLWALSGANTIAMTSYDGDGFADTAVDLVAIPPGSFGGTPPTPLVLIAGTAFFDDTLEDMVSIEYGIVDVFPDPPYLAMAYYERFGRTSGNPVVQHVDKATSCAWRYNPGALNDRYVSGSSAPPGGTSDWIVHGVPFTAPAWTHDYDGGYGKDDVANKIQIGFGVDTLPRLYAVGTLTIFNTTTNQPETEGYAYGYNPMTGQFGPDRWERHSGILGDDTAVDVTSNGEGHVYYVGARSNLPTGAYSPDAVIAKIHSQTGLQLALEFYSGPEAVDLATAVEVFVFDSFEYPDVHMSGRTKSLISERFLVARYLNCPNLNCAP